jgi:hypothetical protein
VYWYDIGTEAQSSQWVGKSSPRPKKKHVKCEVVDRFFNGKGVVRLEFVPRGHTTNGQFNLRS